MFRVGDILRYKDKNSFWYNYTYKVVEVLPKHYILKYKWSYNWEHMKSNKIKAHALFLKVA